MPAKKIEFTNFKGQTGSYTLPHKTIVKGANGAGKTLIRDVIAFGFCGTDSYGVRNPTHLISKDQDSLSVIVTAGGSTFTRTLTRKGNGTVKVMVAGVEQTYNQTQLEEKIGRINLFLSVLVPGYFFRLSEDKKQEVLSDVLPKVDRFALIKEISGLDVTSEEAAVYGFNRRFDLVASSISKTRGTYEKAINDKNGQIKAYRSEVKPLPPEVIDYEVQIKDLDDLKTANTQYESYLKAVKSTETHNAKIDDETLRITKELNETNVEIKFYSDKILPNIEIEETDEKFEARIEDLRKQFLQEPKEPAMFNLITQDNCSTCGQMVSDRHRETVRAQNEKIKEEYLAKLGEVKGFNKGIQDQISTETTARQTLVKSKETVVNSNRDYKAKMQGLENKKAALVFPTMMAFPEIMEKPAEYQMQTHLDLREKERLYNEKVGAYRGLLNAYNQNQEKIKNLEAELVENQATFDRLFKLEEAMKMIPSVELARQAGLFNTENLTFNGEVVLLGGLPYQMLSTGERMAIDKYFSRKINSLWARSHRIIFVDDADLISNDTYLKITTALPEHNEFQEISAYVTESLEVIVSGNE